MQLELTDTQKLIRDTSRTFARDVVAPRARDTDRQEHYPAEVYRQMGELGLLGINVPSEYGGAEAGPVAYALSMIEISAACCSTAVGMAVTNMCAELITAFGTAAQKMAFVTKLVSGEAIAGAFALSEAQAGSDPGAMTTTATLKDGRWVLNGSKQWITSGAHAGVMVVWARRVPRATRAFRASSSRRALRVSAWANTKTRWGCAARIPCRSCLRTVKFPKNGCSASRVTGSSLP